MHNEQHGRFHSVAMLFASKSRIGVGALSEQRQQMKLNSKVTWGLAWIGLAVVVAVPSADFLTGKMGTSGTAAVITSTTDPVTPAKPVVKTATSKPVAPALTAPANDTVKTAAVTTKVTKNGVTIIPAGTDSKDPVDKFLKNGKPLPDYISGGDSSDTAKVTPPTTTQVAALPTAPVAAPVPFPATARPPALPKPAAIVTTPTAPVIVDDSADQQAAIETPDVTPMPPAGLDDDQQYLDTKRARLDRYLERNGLVNDNAPRSSATVTVDRPSRNYDPNGFYLSDGPNSERAARAERRARINRMFAGDEGYDQQDSGDGWFNLF